MRASPLDQPQKRTMSSTQQNLRPTKVKRGSEELTATVTSPLPSKRQRFEAPETDPIMSAVSTSIDLDRINLQAYQYMLAKSPEGSTFLFSPHFSEALQVSAERVAIKYEVTKAKAIEEVRRLIAIKTFTVDEDATKISPTPLMDELWHAAILDTKLYADLQASLGLTLHHRPSGASDQEAEPREKRLTVMKAIYNAFFLTNPLASAPVQPMRTPRSARIRDPQYFIYIKRGTSGTALTINMAMQATIADVKSEIQHFLGLPQDQQLLIYGGQEVEDNRTLACAEGKVCGDGFVGYSASS